MKWSDPAAIPRELWPTAEELPGDLARLAQVIEELAPGRGVELALHIARRFRGTHIYCHNPDAVFRRPRNRWIREQYDAGVRVPDIARAVGLGERQIWHILGSTGKTGDKRQEELF